ncbi:DUF4224 domain-containing protein [Microbulbifer thermotolerans]|uniref:DUF4224 domain-containing protein n=1 Tax=Microbulbifer thermotolerans TaxID=252514 RepID=UPI00346261E3
MSELLTQSELARLTGTKDPEVQRQVLNSNRIPYVRRRDGTVAVTWEIVNQSVLARAGSTVSTEAGTLPPGFNLSAAAN